MAEKSASSALMLLPSPAGSLSFDKNEFMQSDFSVDHFVADCRKHVQLETLRQDLEVYFKLLKNAMIELINKDYADFVNLSGNLVGMEKAIGQLRTPLQTIKVDVTEVQSVVHQEIEEFEIALEKQRCVSEKRKLLGHMQGLLQSIEKIEHIQRSEDTNTGQILERVAGEFNQLQHHTTYCRGLPVLNAIRPRISDLTSYLQSSLEGELVRGISEMEGTHIHRCLNSYALIGKIPDAENLVRNHVVKPQMDRIMQEQQGNVAVPNLNPMFFKILELVPNQLRLLCDITSGRKNRQGDQYRGIPGYDFIVNSAWPEIVLSMERHLPDLFASGDPDKFHARYCLCMEFVRNFERQCGSQASVQRLRQCEAFQALMTHWSLPVYFQIRFQDIGGQLEDAIGTPTKPSSGGDTYRLNISSVLWQCIGKCWKDDIFLAGLLHRFWKLTLQLLARYSTWVKSQNVNQVGNNKGLTTGQDDKLTLNQIAGVVIDLEILCQNVNNLFTETIEPHARKQGLKDTTILKDALTATLEDLTKCKENFVDYIITTLTSQSIMHLKPAQDVPRLYRKTNRQAPTDPSSYVVAVTKPITAFHNEIHQHMGSNVLSDWLTKVTVNVSEKYNSVVSDVLTSVRKMEESLMRLQKMRSAKSSSGNLSSLASGNESLSDDDKIRLQLFLDVTSYGNQVKDCGVNLDNVTSYQSLLAMVTEAKSKNMKIQT